jgi:KDO2-lipid IV(A) lauroyltransferase
LLRAPRRPRNPSRTPTGGTTLASPARQRLDYAALRTLTALAALLPRRALPALGRGLGALVWRWRLYRTAVVRDNLRHAFGATHDESARDAIAAGFFRHFGTNLMEFLLLGRLSRGQLREWVDIEGLEHYHAAAADGRGVLLVTGHFGNWEVLAARLGAEGIPVTFLGKSQSNPQADRMLADLRARAGVRIIRSGGPLKEMVTALRRGEVIGLAADQDAGPDGFFATFLGRPASFYRGAAYFSWKLQAPVISGMIFRLPDGRHRLELGPPYRSEPGWDEATAVARLTEIFAQRLEEAVRRAPDQYFWTHRRWKTRPPEESA